MLIPLATTRRCLSLALAAAVCACATTAGASADIYELEGGGEVRGELVGRGDDEAYIVRTDDGAQVALPRDEIARIVAVDDTLAEYQRRARSTPDTAAGQRELAQWCKEHQLAEEAALHWERLLDFVPDDEEAMISLDYQRVGGRWMTREELMARRGMILYEGKYRTAQHIALRQRDDAQGDLQADWYAKIRRWRGWLDSRREEHVTAARANLDGLSDPAAAPAIVRQLSNEREAWAYGELLKVLARLDHPETVRKLVDVSLHDPNADLRALALDLLTRNGDYVPILPYVRALRSRDNVIVNRAGKALGAIGDPEAVSPLIDALVTEHKYRIEPANPGGITTGSVNGNAGLNVGDRPKIIVRMRQNPEVLRALTSLTSEHDLEYDERAWRSWFINQQEAQLASARRDE
ncbi:MAG: hypothetical protein CMJ58_26455 [Planctomycetaceae bacterium]|nr:hypothetical protein [Planctomycetaceae bacterium]